jgi:hypothetical protein
MMRYFIALLLAGHRKSKNAVTQMKEWIFSVVLGLYLHIR